MREAFVGFDSAWGGKQPGGIVSVSFDNGELDSWSRPEPASFECAARIIEKLRDKHNYVLVALDQPTLVPNEKGMRPVEKVASSLICKLGSGVQPASRIMSRGHAARYNPDKKSFLLCDWKLVANTVARHIEDLGVPLLSQWARMVAGYDIPDKKDQDQLDAAICLIIALR